jgi:hypothetical protein
MGKVGYSASQGKAYEENDLNSNFEKGKARTFTV